ncbi:unnamed protein product [Urochloa humidicola]
MGDEEVLMVRFHFNGDFVVDGSQMQYCNGDIGVSHIEKDKLSIPELNGHLLDHTTFHKFVRMYWLPVGAKLSSGMRLLVDDKSCMDMVNEIGASGAVDIYSETIQLDMSGNEGTEIQYGDDDVFNLFRDENIMDLDAPIAATDGCNAMDSIADAQNAQSDEQHVENEGLEEEEEEDSDFDATGFTSDEDDEVREIRTKYKKFMAEAKKRGDMPLDEDTPVTSNMPGGSGADNNIQVNESGDGIAYFESDHEASYNEDSDGQGTK